MTNKTQSKSRVASQKSPAKAATKTVTASKKSAAKSSEVLPFGKRLGNRLGPKRRPVVRSLIRATYGFLGVILGYALVMTLATSFIPNTVGLVGQASGITTEAPFDQVTTLWLAPSLFITIVLAGLAVWALKSLAKAVGILNKKTIGWLGIEKTGDTK